MFFNTPTQVKIRTEDREGCYGIAYRNFFICACCGNIFPINEVSDIDIETLHWKSFKEAIK